MEQGQEKKKRGGYRENSGRKPIQDEVKKNQLIQKAVNDFYKADNDDDGKVALIKDLLSFERGKIVVTEHLFGKPKEVIENHNFDAGILTKEEINDINEQLNTTY